MEAFDDLEDGNDGNSIVTKGAVIAGGSSDNVLINPFQNLGEDIRAVLVGRTALGAELSNEWKTIPLLLRTGGLYAPQSQRNSGGLRCEGTGRASPIS